MSKLIINSDLSTGGLYRAVLNYDGTTANVFIPCMVDSNTKKENGFMWEAIFSSEEMKNTALIGESACWVTFENSNAKRPIIVGYFGSGIRSIGGIVISDTESNDENEIVEPMEPPPPSVTNESNTSSNDNNTELVINEPNYTWNGTFQIRQQTNYIVIHHTATTGDINATDIHGWHKDNGWTGIGYHFYVKKDGSVYRGRPINVIGAHVSGHNSDSIGVSFEGNWESVDTDMNQNQLTAGRKLLKYLKELYPHAEFKGHRDLGSSQCPGTNFPFDTLINGI